jgi:hypothetical protein
VTRQYVDTPGYKEGTKVEVRQKPCDERVALALEERKLGVWAAMVR